VNHISPGGAPCHEGSRHEFGPGLDVPGCVAHHGWLPSGTRGGVDSNYIVHGHREHPKGVVVPQIVFVGKRQPAQIVKGTYIIL
jgi:hypothetical protein